MKRFFSPNVCPKDVNLEVDWCAIEDRNFTGIDDLNDDHPVDDSCRI